MLKAFTHGVPRPGISIKPGWHAPVNIAGSPIVGGHTVYSLSMNDGMLDALNSDTGTVRARVSVGNVTRFATPTLWQGMVYVGTLEGAVAVKIL